MTTTFKLFVGFLLSGFIASCSAGEHSLGVDRAVISSIHAHLTDVIQASGTEKVNRLSHLSAEIESLGATERATIPEVDIRTIAALLEDENQVVRVLAATCLGNIGPPARDTVADLKRAVEKIKSEEAAGFIRPSVSGTYAIYIAIEKISGEPPPSDY